LFQLEKDKIKVITVYLCKDINRENFQWMPSSMEAYKREWITSVCPSHQLMRIDEGMIIEGPFRPDPNLRM